MTVELNKIYQGDCVEVMKQWPESFIDLVVTSPPYDNLREYARGEWSFDAKSVFTQLLRILSPGWVCVWVVADQTKGGCESLSSFKQAICAVDCGFNLHDTMIYQKNGLHFPDSRRYQQVFEYMFIFSKGTPKTFNPLKRPTIWGGITKTSTSRNPDGTINSFRATLKETTIKDNVWLYEVGFMKSSDDPSAFEHPAVFPEKLAGDHIVSWSNECDLVYDPFLGSGTTAIIALRANRKFIATEINPKYVQIAQKRVDAEMSQMKLF